VAFPRGAIVDRLNANVDTLISTLGGGKAARALFLAEVYSPGDSGNSSRLSDRWHDLPQVDGQPSVVVLRDLPYEQHAVRHQRLGPRHL
jgi:hypothetical protein